MRCSDVHKGGEHHLWPFCLGNKSGLLKLHVKAHSSCVYDLTSNKKNNINDISFFKQTLDEGASCLHQGGAFSLEGSMIDEDMKQHQSAHTILLLWL